MKYEKISNLPIKYIISKILLIRGKKRGKKDDVLWDTQKDDPDDKKQTSYAGLVSLIV